MAVTPLVGMLLDRLPTRPLYAAALLSVSVALAAMSLVGDLASAIVFSVPFGVANAAMHAHFTFVWPRFFDRGHLGSIQGVAQMGGVIGASIGPIPLGTDTTILVAMEAPSSLWPRFRWCARARCDRHARAVPRTSRGRGVMSACGQGPGP